MFGLAYRFRVTLRVIAALTAAAFLFADWAAAASEYVNLSCCPQHTVQDPQLQLAASDSRHHHEADVGDPADPIKSVSEPCCETCDRCNGYIDAHFVAVGFASDCDRVVVLQSFFPVPTARMADSFYPPAPPPPRSVVSARC